MAMATAMASTMATAMRTPEKPRANQRSIWVLRRVTAVMVDRYQGIRWEVAETLFPLPNVLKDAGIFRISIDSAQNIQLTTACFLCDHFLLEWFITSFALPLV